METNVTRERFQPRPTTVPDTFLARGKFLAQRAIDFQVKSVYRHARQFLPGVRGLLLDVGAGNSPYRHLLDPTASQYQGIDVQHAGDFGYSNAEIQNFDGRQIPFDGDSFDAVLCTEVLEHVEDPAELITEIHRVMKPGATGMITVPWSARFHYIPHDYHRYTPTRLQHLFQHFASATVVPRGTDLTVVASKIVVMYARLFFPRHLFALLWTIPLAVILAPIVAGFVLLGHLSLVAHVGSSDDPLGYTVWLRK